MDDIVTPATELETRWAVPLAGLSRLGFAAWFAADPGAPARAWELEPGPRAQAVARVLTARELVLGVGTLAAWATGRRTSGWVAAMAVAETVNGTVTLVAGLRGTVPLRRALGLAAFDLSGTVSEAWLARRLAAAGR